VLVASDLFSTLSTRWRLDDFTHVEIPRSLAQWQRWDLLARTSEAVAAACARGARPPAVLMECGSLASWLITRLFIKHPRVFYLDLGQALNGWFFDVVDPAGSAWARTYACSVIANCHLESYYGAQLGARYDEWIATVSRPDLARDRAAQRKAGGDETRDGTKREILGPADLVGSIKARSPGLFDTDITDETASALVTQALEVIREHLGDAQEGEMQIKGLGAFQIRQVERGEGDARVTRKVINLRLK
jgi:nucleoid DNA-binding protein